MTFVLKESGSDIVGGRGFESFWLFVPFKIQERTLTIIEEACFFAVYGSYTSAHRSMDLPSFGEKPGESQTKHYELVGDDKLSLKLKSLGLQESRCVDFANESSQLHIFGFQNTADEKPKTWLDDGGWNATYETPTACHNPRHPYIPHEVSFGTCSARNVYWAMSRDTQHGTNRMALALPFLKGSLASNILANHEEDSPKLEVTVNKQKWSMFDTPSPSKKPYRGYAMVCSGVFKQMSLSAEIENWHKLVLGAKDAVDVLDALSAIAERRGRALDGQQLFTRTLQSVDVTDDNSVVRAEGELPVEVFYAQREVPTISERLITYK